MKRETVRDSEGQLVHGARVRKAGARVRRGAAFLLFFAAVGPGANGAPTITVGPMEAGAYERHQVAVTVTNPDPGVVSIRLEFTIKPPGERARTVQAEMTVPKSGKITHRFHYELFEPGDHTVTCRARTGKEELARWSGILTVADADEVPRLFPNYYRKRLLVVGGRDVTTSFGAFAPLGKDARTVAAQGSGTVRFRTSTAFRTLPVTVVPRPATKNALYGIDEHNRLIANGRPWFPLGIYTAPETEEACKELADAGFDLVRLHALPGPVMTHALDLLRTHGLRAWVPLSARLQFAEGDVAKKQDFLRKLVAAVGSHPGLALWESRDEPAWGGRAARGLRQGYLFLRNLDANRPIWTNHAPRNRIATLAFYNQATDIAGCDVYPVPPPCNQSNLPNKTLSVVGDETAKSVDSVAGDKPVFMVLQAFAWRALSRRDDPEAVYPTFAESRFMAYDAIVAGARGILYWGIHATPRPSRFWSDLKSVVSELRAVTPALEALPVEGDTAARIVPDSRAVALSHRKVAGHDLLIVVNRTGERQAIRIHVPGAAGTTSWHVLFDADASSLTGSDMTVALPTWGVLLLSNDPKWQPRRKNFDAELVNAKPPRPLPMQPGNSVPNPSFEMDDNGDRHPDGWRIRYLFTGKVDTAVSHSGNASLLLESRAKEFVRPLAVMNNCRVEKDSRYRLSGWFRTDTPGVKARIYAEWVVDGRFHGHVLPWFEPGRDWTERHVDVETTPNPAGRLYVVAQIEGMGRVWFDDIRLEKVQNRPPE